MFLEFTKAETIKNKFGYEHNVKFNINFDKSLKNIQELKTPLENRWHNDVKTLTSNIQ